MSVEKKVPEIRFKGFSGEWLNNPIGEICGSTFGGGTPSTGEKDFWQGKTPWIQSSDIKEGSVSSVTAKKHITKTAVNKSATKLVAGNSIAIVTRVGVGKLSLMESEYATSQDFLSLSELKINAQYAVYIILKQLQSEKEQVQGTSIKGITKEELLGKLISYPKTKEEQTAIGNTFQKLDSLIHQHQQKHDKLSSIKKAMLEKMFPKQGETLPEIRFKGFSGEWEEKELNTISDKVTDKNTSITYSETFTNSAEFGIISQRDYFDKDISNSSNIGGYYIVRSDYFVYNPRISTLAPCGPINRNTLNRTGVMSPLYTVFKTKGVNAVFIEFFFKTNLWHDFMFLNGDTGARADRFSIKDSVFFELPMPIPLIEEQTAIGNYFQKLDALINQHQNQITKLNNIKQACLSKMFV